MEELVTENQSYYFKQPEIWAPQYSDDEIKKLITETDFSKQWTNEGRDYCFFLDKIFYTNERENSEYVCMAYTLNEPANLERASVYDMVVEENESYVIHRISVFRNGEIIDKTADIKIKVLDNENQSGGGVLSSNKKINVTIKDLRLYDVLIIEDSRNKIFSERDFLRKEFARYVWVSPDTYWAYGKYKFTFINDRDKEVSYKKNFFRNEHSQLVDPTIDVLAKGEKFIIEEDNYFNTVDSNRQVYPYIDFATKATWKELSNYIFPLYDEVFKKKTLAEFAPDLVQQLDAINDLEEKIQFAIDYVQNHVYYVFNADEMNGHKPQEPEVTYQNKQGDCNAKTVLLKTILDYLQVDSSIVLVNFNTDFYQKYYLPSLLAFNHVIVKINHNNETYFVDATMRDEFGLLENRGFIYFMHYLEVKPDQEVQIQKPHKFKKYCVNEKVDFIAKGDQGSLQLTTTYWGNRANSMRRYFKNTNRREIIDSWNSFLYYTLNYSNDRNGTDFRTIFKDASIEILSDDKRSNEFTIQYKATIDGPYFVDDKNNRFLMYFDRNIVKNQIRDFLHDDMEYWHNLDSEKYEINLVTDQKIDTQERYTIQESEIHNKYYDFVSKKNITKNSGSIFIEFNPTVNLDIPKEDFADFQKGHQTIADSNFGIGLDIIEAGFMNSLKFSFKKKFG